VKKKSFDSIPENDVTDPEVYLRRRDFLRGTAAAAVTLATGVASRAAEAPAGGPFDATDPPTPFEDASRYNNFYEFGTDKRDPARNSGSLRTRPWSVRIEGEVAKPRTVAFEDLLAAHPPEDRIYRLRCVEAWSMVIPWRGFPLADLLKRLDPTSSASFYFS
jgi:sulfoxide reductase catalytic subunit YedY